jgi:probable HAF family extracellular repeat protein
VKDRHPSRAAALCPPALLLALALSVPASAVAAGDYRLHMLPSLGGFASSAHGINFSGVIVGSSETLDGVSHPVRWKDGEVLQLGTDPGGAVAINDLGAIVVGSDGNATVVRPGQPPVALPFDTYPVMINNHGTMAGSVGNGDAAVITKTRIQRIGGLPGNYLSEASYINDNGVVVGQSLVNPGMEPTLWKDGQVYQLPVPLDFGGASAINDHGVIVGSSWGWNGPSQAIRWEHMQPIALPAPTNSAAYAINNRGEVVGWIDGTAPPATDAALWTCDGGLVDLNDYVDPDLKQAGWILTFAWAINDHGWIVGEMANTNSGEVRAFVLTK